MMTRCGALLFVVAGCLMSAGNLAAQDDPFGVPAPAVQPINGGLDGVDIVVEEAPTAPQPVKPDSPSSSEDEEEPVVEKSPPIDPQSIRLNLMDGSVITGKLEVKEIEIETKFGSLTIPVEAIKSFKPGLDSYPDLKQEVDGFIENLGSDDYAEREAARKSLARMGSRIETELKRHLKDKNAERVRQIKAILEEFATAEEFSADDEGATPESAWSRLDMVETTDFTVLGKISPQSFQVTSQYGPLNIQLAHIRTAERNLGTKQQVRRSLSVSGQNLANLAFKNSGIRLKRGDRVSVTADGQIMMTPWGSGTMSTPEGGANFGADPNQIPGGALVARIGDSGKVFKVGAKHSFQADRTGTLQFAIAMQYDYAQGNYQFPGEYKLKIKVDPK